MTLTEYENLCLYGPLGSVKPEDGDKMFKQIESLMLSYRDRLKIHAQEWQLINANKSENFYRDRNFVRGVTMPSFPRFRAEYGDKNEA